ncbi:hypothetical protein AGMMS49983_21930 [Clostridia bacterium]|nr:hypothetical protein AGMMS49983_21930 [Clostridia bacterium]
MRTAASPLFIMLFSIAAIWRGLVAFFPALRTNKRKERKPIPKAHGIFYLTAGLLGFLYSLYVIYIFAGGTHVIFPIANKTLFRSADVVLIVFLVAPFFLRIIIGKNKAKNDT